MSPNLDLSGRAQRIVAGTTIFVGLERTLSALVGVFLGRSAASPGAVPDQLGQVQASPIEIVVAVLALIVVVPALPALFSLGSVLTARQRWWVHSCIGAGVAYFVGVSMEAACEISTAGLAASFAHGPPAGWKADLRLLHVISDGFALWSVPFLLAFCVWTGRALRGLTGRFATAGMVLYVCAALELLTLPGVVVGAGTPALITSALAQVALGLALVIYGLAVQRGEWLGNEGEASSVETT